MWQRQIDVCQIHSFSIRMPYREFTDSTGVPWKVWNTVPTAGAVITRDIGDGWLTFESATSRRRLAPVPPDWERVPPERLELMCRAATDAPRVTPHGVARFRDPDDAPSHG
jgi:hypothetical protein